MFVCSDDCFFSEGTYWNLCLYHYICQLIITCHIIFAENRQSLYNSAFDVPKIYIINS